MRAQHKAAARKTHGVAAFTEDELAERDAAIRAAAFEEGAQEGAQAVIDAQAARSCRRRAQGWRHSCWPASVAQCAAAEAVPRS